MALQEWALPRFRAILELDDDSLSQIITYCDSLTPSEAAEHLKSILGDSPQALDLISSFNARRSSSDAKTAHQDASRQPAQTTSDVNYAAPAFAPPAYPPPTSSATMALRRPHRNAVIDAGEVRARDEQEMQNMLQNLQFQYRIYNSEIEPEHDADYYCNCPIHNYVRMKYNRIQVQDMWSNAVLYPGEKAYTDSYQQTGAVFSRNPYRLRVVSPYGFNRGAWGYQGPRPDYHAKFIRQTIDLNNQYNHEAQTSIDAKEPKINIWDEDDVNSAMAKLSLTPNSDKRKPSFQPSDNKRPSMSADAASSNGQSEAPPKQSKLSSFRKSIGLKSSEERAVAATTKQLSKNEDLKQRILAEEQGRWPDEQWRQIVAAYQQKVGMAGKIADLRMRQPIQYLHLLAAGYFEPIPVAWAGNASNPLKFSIEAASGWRGITPSWRGYEDTAEERLYWVLNHREGSVGMRMKPDFISTMDMARRRMASAVEPPPEYYSINDICHVQHTSPGYSKQVMPPPFHAFDRPALPADNTMILLDTSGSMDFEPLRPNYDQYLITGYSKSTQPKNRDVAKAIVRRFTDAMSNHDHQFQGYSLVTFANEASHIGTINHQNLDKQWRKVHFGGGTRVMTGWQKVKELHFQQHSESATHHPIYGWQAGPETPMLRLLLLLDGEATDMDEFELDLLGLSWAHVTIFLIGVDGCPHHHRHANELQRISDVNHHVSFVDAQGNTPERFVTHELLKRHLGYDISMQEFQQMEELPTYQDAVGF